jgi:hypothetical protein
MNLTSFRSIGMACGASLMLAMASVSLGQNLLSDPGFEGVNASANDVPMAGSGGAWSGWNNWVSPYSGYYTASVAHSGLQAAKTFSGPNAGIYQYVPVTAGQTYTASAYFENSSTDVITDTAATEDVRMIFFSGANGTGSALATDVAPVNFVPGTSPVNTWVQLTVTGAAPAGTESVQWMAFFNNPDYASGSMFVDDASLTAVPEPASLGLLAIGGLAALRRKR